MSWRHRRLRSIWREAAYLQRSLAPAPPKEKRISRMDRFLKRYMMDRYERRRIQEFEEQVMNGESGIIRAGCPVSDFRKDQEHEIECSTSD